MARTGWIKLHRGLLDWEWYHDPNTFRVFMHLLLTANFDDNEYMGVKLKRGQCIVSVSKLAEELRLTIRQARTALEHLKTTSEVTIETTNKFSIVTIANYEKYQGVEGSEGVVDNSESDKQNDKQGDNQTTNKTPENDKQNDKPSLYTKNYKESLSKNDKNIARARVREAPVDNFNNDDDEFKGMSKAMRDVMMYRRMCEENDRD